MKQTVCSICPRLLEESCSEKHIQQYQHVTQMSQVEPSEHSAQTACQLTDCMVGGYETHQDCRQWSIKDLYCTQYRL